MEKQLTQYKKIHLVGIKGAGMTALAEILAARGVKLSGSDTEEVFFTDKILKKIGIAYAESFDEKNIPPRTELVIHSTVYHSEKNPELRAAAARGIPLLSYPEAVGKLSKEKLTLAVAGTHGKTTTSAMFAEVLKFCGKDPLAIVGSRILSWKGNALSGTGEFFVLEADEYQNKLAAYTPFGVLLTSVDWDHPDFFPDIQSYEKVFREFIARIPAHGFLVFCNDHAGVKRIADEARSRKISYGFLPGALYRTKDYLPRPLLLIPEKQAPKQSFSVFLEDAKLGDFTLQLAGRHNALNATAVIAAAHHLKLDLDRVKTALAKFEGTERRLEYIGERYGAPIYDDYAHHPEEIRATLQALKELYPERRIRAIFQPHTFSRTEALFSDFAQSFEAAEEVTLLPIYASAREEKGAVNSEELAKLINRFFPGKARYAPVGASLAEEMQETLGRSDVVVTLGAGSGWQIARQLAKKL